MHRDLKNKMKKKNSTKNLYAHTQHTHIIRTKYSDLSIWRQRQLEEFKIESVFFIAIANENFLLFFRSWLKVFALLHTHTYIHQYAKLCGYFKSWLLNQSVSYMN